MYIIHYFTGIILKVLATCEGRKKECARVRFIGQFIPVLMNITLNLSLFDSLAVKHGLRFQNIKLFKIFNVFQAYLKQ